MEREAKRQLQLSNILDINMQVASILENDLNNNCENFRTANELESWANMSIPKPLPECYRPNLSYSLLHNVFEKHVNDILPLSQGELFNYAMIYSGVHPIDFESRNWARLLNIYPPNHSFPFITGELNSRRTPCRSIPPSFQTNEILHTPFIARGSKTEQNSIELFFTEHQTKITLGYMKRILPLDSPNVIAYIRKLKGPEHKQDLSITINPILACSERCSFCYRQYRLLDKSDSEAIDKHPLIRIQPDVIARYLRIKFADLDLRRVKHFSLVTGAFKNYDDLYNYIDRFNKEIKAIIHGKFNFKNDQGITILTHLATTREQMEGLRDLGVTELQHTMEVFDDKTRSEIMPILSKSKNSRPKSTIKFNEVLSMVEPGQKIFGGGFSVSSILGIDNLTSTIDGLRKLKAAGLIKLAFPVYQTYNIEGLGLYKMSFPDLIEARQKAKRLFVRKY